MAEKNNQNNNNLNVSISDEVATGVYSNLAVITHSPAEFILDFAQALPGREGAVIRRRIIMPPVHAKRLLMALSGNIKKYEETFGTIEEPHGPNDAIPYNMVPQGKA